MSSQGERPGHDHATGRHAAEQRPLTSVRTRQEHIAYVAGKYTALKEILSHRVKDQLRLGF